MVMVGDSPNKVVWMRAWAIDENEQKRVVSREHCLRTIGARRVYQVKG